MSGLLIGDRIRAVRVRAKLSQDQFAAALGYSKRALVGWEANVAEPPVAVVAKLRQLYDVAPEWFVMGDDVIPRKCWGPVDWERLDRLADNVDQVCIDVGIKLKPGQRTSLTRILYDGDDDPGPATKKRLRGMLLTLSQRT